MPKIHIEMSSRSQDFIGAGYPSGEAIAAMLEDDRASKSYPFHQGEYISICTVPSQGDLLCFTGCQVEVVLVEYVFNGSTPDLDAFVFVRPPRLELEEIKFGSKSK